ncbi:branched-chain amino acid transport [Spirochaeta thermophila DSM 6578]|uniref:Branched-chain amino acid transport n=1 Tax=Winmispira thermophila (strain ATCC 700085 / DSM 6578 / Z-1203) TaxID=869211 RepID=G0GAA9_WINT7|nr:AzlD domain-containing protein [Spirochaeta thermophila]AEJ60945.1 branched-chain amino acid transport [Spirochaeta thermophila DSM 6578]
MDRYAAILLVAVGTYLIRLLPFFRKEGTGEGMERVLKDSAAAVMAALWISSFVSLPLEGWPLVRDGLALLGVLGSYLLWRRMGVSVLVGVGLHALLSLWGG